MAADYAAIDLEGLLAGPARKLASIRRVKIIPVMLGRPRSGADNIFATRPPIIHVHLAYDKTWNCQSEGLPHHTTSNFDALLDTGAD